MKKTFLTAITMVLFLVSCSQKSTDVISSALHFEEGFTQTLVFGTATEANQMGSFEDMNEVYFQLDQITPDSTFIFTGKVTRMQYKADIMGEKENVDTEIVKALNTVDEMSTTELEMYNEIKQYIDKEFTVILDKYGNLIQKATFKDTSSFMDASILQQYSPVPTFSFPEGTLAVGTTWNYETKNPIVPSQNMKFSYTIDDITATTIFVDVNVDIDGISGVLEKMNAKGMYEIDRKTKRFIKGERTMNMQIGGGKATYKIYEQ
ncbi:MAG: hypothetical protein AAF617_05230 [Bacteroidota bacterium]